jgi:glycine/D-amino acid oxidase-like deaminating enzyme
MRGRVVVVGAGIFGVTAGREFGRRDWNVVVLDPGPVPHPLAESTDISKIVRMDYGADEDYTALMEVALEGWRRWNAGWPAPLFHETGVTFLSRAPLAPGGFEYESWRVLTGRGHRLERIDAAALRRRFPAWNADRFVDGYFNPAGGYAESSKVVAALWAEAARDGGEVRGGERVVRLVEEADGPRVAGVVTARGEILPAEVVVVAAGSWTQHLLPWLAPHLRSVGQPVFHPRPADVTRFRAAV